MQYYAKMTKSEGVFRVFFPDLPNVITFGETKEEAQKNAVDALNGVLETDCEAGYTLSVPKQKAGKCYYPVEVAPYVEFSYLLRFLRNKRS